MLNITYAEFHIKALYAECRGATFPPILVIKCVTEAKLLVISEQLMNEQYTSCE